MSVPDPVVRSTAWCAVLGYALVALGLPLPCGTRPVEPSAGRSDPVAARLLAAKDRSRPFPCMDKACGCATAEQCFTNCCCHSPAERLAWARARGLEGTVQRALAQATAPRSAAAPCCTAAAPRPAPAAVRCGPEGGCCAPEDTPQPAPARATARSRSVSLQAVLACAGIVQQWFAAGSSLPPPRVAHPRPLPGPERIELADAGADSVAALPDVPPPRVA